MEKWVKRYEVLIVGGLLLWGTWFMLRMAYLPVWKSSLICVLWLACGYVYLKYRYQLRVPFFLLFLIYATVLLDGLGNYFNFYNTKFRFIQYDEFTHTAAPALAAPVLVWLLHVGLERMGYRLPLGLTTLFALTTMFTISGFYEIVELWDDKYMHPAPGMRIHGPYDTANDLQCDLAGLIVGGLAVYVYLKRSKEKASDSLAGLGGFDQNSLER
ncbi:MAG: hypothetical protein IPM66_01175 [Acidobacteriota bacterium]|nr:MAG: hypothetical protein IPM66_01175 [Acidobacteriota bacterium]